MLSNVQNYNVFIYSWFFFCRKYLTAFCPTVFSAEFGINILQNSASLTQIGSFSAEKSSIFFTRGFPLIEISQPCNPINICQHNSIAIQKTYPQKYMEKNHFDNLFPQNVSKCGTLRISNPSLHHRLFFNFFLLPSFAFSIRSRLTLRCWWCATHLFVKRIPLERKIIAGKKRFYGWHRFVRWKKWRVRLEMESGMEKNFYWIHFETREDDNWDAAIEDGNSLSNSFFCCLHLFRCSFPLILWAVWDCFTKFTAVSMQDVISHKISVFSKHLTLQLVDRWKVFPSLIKRKYILFL